MIQLNLWDGCHEEWQRIGIQSIKIAIDLIDKKTNPYQFRYEINKDLLTVNWEGNDVQAWGWLFKSYVQLKDGVVVTPFSEFFQHVGMLSTLLQVPKTRTKSDSDSAIKRFYENNHGCVYFNYLKLQNIIHYQYAQKLFTTEKLLTPSWLIPNCLVDPYFSISFEVALASWFAFPLCSFCQGREETYLVAPVFKDFIKTTDIKTPDIGSFKAANIYDAAIQCLINNPLAIGVKCFSYKHEKANRANRINSIINVFRKNIDWESALKVSEIFPNSLFNKGDYIPFIKVNNLRGWLCKNICEGQPLWHDIDSVDPAHLRENGRGLQKMFFPNTCKPKEVKNIDSPIVDDCDRHLLENYKWRKGKDCGWFRRYREDGKHKTLYLHREILNASGNQNIQVRFKDGDKNNCCRDNLEALTMSEFRKLSHG